MRILINTTVLSPSGGTELHALQISRELARRGHEIDILAQTDGLLRSDYEEFARTVLVCGDFLHGPLSIPQLRHPERLAKWMRAMRSAVSSSRRLRPDVIYANTAQSLMWACSTSGRSGTPIVCHLHGVAGRPIGRQRGLMARMVATFVTPSAFVREDWVRHGLPADRIQVVPQAIDPKTYPPATPQSRTSARTRFGLSPTAFVVLYLGRVVPDKGVDLLVRAWKRMGLGPDAGYLLVVGPSAPDYAAHLHELAPTNCHFVDMQADVVPVLHAADLLVLPALWEEPFGRVIIEAMATGCPAVASRVGGISEILTGEFSPMLFERGSEEELTARLSELQHWRRDEPGLADSCVAHIAESFDLASAVDKIEHVLESSRFSRSTGN
jgi:glycosyltransferase involved in cell wall biosynthesis